MMVKVYRTERGVIGLYRGMIPTAVVSLTQPQSAKSVNP